MNCLNVTASKLIWFQLIGLFPEGGEKKNLPCQTFASVAATDRPRSFFTPQQHIVGRLNSSICCDYVQMAFICHPFQSCSAALWLEADDADQITAGLLSEKDTHTIGFVKYSLQYVAIILTFVGVSLCFRSIFGF